MTSPVQFVVHNYRGFNNRIQRGVNNSKIFVRVAKYKNPTNPLISKIRKNPQKSKNPQIILNIPKKSLKIPGYTIMSRNKQSRKYLIGCSYKNNEVNWPLDLVTVT